MGSWWHLTSPVEPAPPVAELPRSTAVAIVGGGMMGASLALWLTRLGVEPLVLERRFPACAASGRNGGLAVVGAHGEYVEVAAQLGEQAATELVLGTRESHALLRAFLEERGLGELWQGCGYLVLWSTEEDGRVFVESAPIMSRLGWETRVLDHAGCERVLGARLSERLVGGVWTPDDGMVQPVAYVNALARAAQERGARFGYPVEVRGLARRQGGWELDTSRGRVAAEQVVVAANQLTERLVPGTASLFRYPRDLVAVTEPLERPPRTSWAEESVAPYGGPLRDGRLLVGGFARVGLVPAASEDPPVQPGQVQARLEHYLAETFPELERPRVVHAWAGTLAITLDHLPLVGPWPKAEGLWLLAGFGGQGLAFSQWAPKLLAEAIARSGAARLPAYLLPGRFFPPRRQGLASAP